MTDSINNHYQLDEQALRTALTDSQLAPWIDALIAAVNARTNNLHHGDLSRWQAALDALPDLPITRIDLDHESGVAVLTDKDIAADDAAKLLNDDADANDASNTNDASDANDASNTYDASDVDDASDASGVDDENQANDINVAHDINNVGDTTDSLQAALEGLMPWRKGPFRIAHVTIDTEWRSNWKWNRVYPHITPLQDRTVLDVGCGSGYHLWRMRSQGASTVIGIDPGLLFLMQFQALQRYVKDSAVNMLPLTMETLPPNMHSFDTVFSMGVLYHRKDPKAHLNELMQSLSPGGELVLETLVSLGEERTELKIDGRYARMRNVWTLPSVPMLARWMIEAGFTNIRCVSVDITSRLEQRTTPWMPYESLIDSLDPDDLSLTVEGLPRPRRAVMIADAP